MSTNEPLLLPIQCPKCEHLWNAFYPDGFTPQSPKTLLERVIQSLYNESKRTDIEWDFKNDAEEITNMVEQAIESYQESDNQGA